MLGNSINSILEFIDRRVPCVLFSRDYAHGRGTIARKFVIELSSKNGENAISLSGSSVFYYYP